MSPLKTLFCKCRRCALALTAGLLYGASFSYAGFFLSLIALVTFLYVLLSAAKPSRAFGLAWLFWTAGFASGLSWLYTSIVHYGGVAPVLGVLGVLLFGAFLGLFGAAGAWAAARLTAPDTAARLGALAALTGLSECLRATVGEFGWLTPAYALLDTPYAHWAAVGGVWLVNALWLASAALLARLLFLGGNKVVAGVALAALVAGGFAVERVKWAEPATLSQWHVVQPDLPVTNRPTVAENDDRIAQMKRYAEQRWPAKNDKGRAMVLPEGVVTVPVSRLSPVAVTGLEAVVREAQAPILFTALRGERRQVFNSAFWFDGTVEQIVDKRRLVPFGEYVPKALRWLPELFGVEIGDMTPGNEKEYAPYYVGETPVAVLICYENLFGDLLPSFWAKGPAPELFVVTSNLGWFGPSIVKQHLDMTRMRSIESARPFISVNNNGGSALVGAGGVLLAQLGMGKASAFWEVCGRQGEPTPYLRFGDAPACVLMILAALWAFAAARRAGGQPRRTEGL